jgi:hypothetical protein
MQYHGLLDWRLAIDMARVALDDSASCDLESPLSASVGNQWRHLLDGEETPISRTLSQFGYAAVPNTNGIVFLSSSRKRVLIAHHPLWTDERLDVQAAAREIERDQPGFEIERLDVFVAMRRPADYL